MIFTDNQIQKLQKMGYRFAGNNYHAAAKICHWTKKSILDEGVCYKEKFYGIKSHRCLQMSECSEDIGSVGAGLLPGIYHLLMPKIILFLFRMSILP